MSDKIFLRLLILCAIWSHRIIRILADEEIKDSLDRQKRVVSYIRDENISLTINEAPYVVFIKENLRIGCVGSILSQFVVITSAVCASSNPQHYKVFSGTIHTNAANYRSVTKIRKRIADPHLRRFDGVALLVVNRPFEYSQDCLPIKLHIGALLIGSFGKISGWGLNFQSQNRGTNIPTELRSIEVPVISHQDCVNRYRPHLEISVKNVCTFHSNRHSEHIDFGAGLVVDGRLAGVFLWSGLSSLVNPQYPDVFVSLHDNFYFQWIISNVQSISLDLQNIHHY